MKDTIIRLNEDIFRRIISESVKGVLSEIGYRGAALAHGANYNAQQDYFQNRNVNSRSKMDKSEITRLKALSLAINDNFPNLVLEFVEMNKSTNMAYSVNLHFNEVKYIDKERFVLKGYLDVASKQYGIGTIEYNFNTQEFYRVSYSDKTTRSRRLHTLIAHNQNVINDLLSFISNYQYSTEDYENNVNVNRPTPSKKH